MSAATSNEAVGGPIVAPYPVYLSATVIPGFGRGSADLGIPTANIPSETLLSSGLLKDQTGIYFGYAKVSGTYGTLESRPTFDELKAGKAAVVQPHPDEPLSEADGQVLPMAMSLGYNPFYGNKESSAEIYIVHKYAKQFYGANIKVIVLGFIRPELNFESLDAMITQINADVEYAKRTLATAEYAPFETDAFFAQ
ncbi:uncharacterized protein V1510DRAFT_415673 [Dipodascopsis tothii]|uniref:uncharacterized protein n=1 Tax=Dipodascopsis tothii TaxID=44089 RepID=UPI0034CDB069